MGWGAKTALVDFPTNRAHFGHCPRSGSHLWLPYRPASSRVV
jgi:hypothetical protein